MSESSKVSAANAFAICHWHNSVSTKLVNGEEADRLKALNAELVAMLVYVEWSATDSCDVCPSCWTDQAAGHSPGCRLASLLKRAKENK